MDAAEREAAAAPDDRFAVRLDVFEGPFDLLLSLIARHKLDLTEVALAKVTDDFLGYLRTRGPQLRLGSASEFLVVAATLLSLKAARLLPPDPDRPDDEEDVALLEARDLLFARLLQYRAYKTAAVALAERMAQQGRSYPRSVTLEPAFADLLPEVLLGIGPAELAGLAARALAPKPVAEPKVPVDHLRVPAVDVAEQATVLTVRLRAARSCSFRALVAECAGTPLVVGRFLALLTLYRDGAVSFEQPEPLGELVVQWVEARAGAVADAVGAPA